VLDSSSLALNHLYIEVCNNPVQHLMENSPDLRLNCNFERVSSVGLVSIAPDF